MKPSSAKAKGRMLQQKVRDKILARFPHLELDDVRSTSMGAGGEDLQLSPAARRSFPFSVECKKNAAFAVMRHFDQAKSNAGGHTPILVIEENRGKPTVLIGLDDFLSLLCGTGSIPPTKEG